MYGGEECPEAWAGSAPAGDSLQALAESFPAGLLVPLEGVGRPRWNVLGSRDCQPKERQCRPGLAILPTALIGFVLPSDTNSFGGHDVLFIALLCFVETGSYFVTQAGLKPKVILLPQLPESCIHRCRLPCMPVSHILLVSVYPGGTWDGHVRQE